MPFMKLLQNKTVVSCLAVAAALFVAGQFVKWPDRKSIAAAARPTAAPPVELVTYTLPPALRIGESLSGWRELFPLDRLRRDPFSQPRAVPSGPVETNRAVIAAPDFVVQAISMNGHQTLAVLNRQLVTLKDRVGDYVVDDIRPTEVWLTGPAGRLVIPLRRSSLAPKTVATGTPASADHPTGSAGSTAGSKPR